MRKTSSHVFFRPFRKRTYSSMLRDNKIFVSVMCSLSEAVWLQSNLRQILFFSSPAGNGMEQKNEPPIIKTLRGRKDTLIAENKYPLRKVTVCDRGKNTYSISGWELLLSIDKPNTPHAHEYFREDPKICLRNPMLSSKNCVIRNDFWKKRKSVSFALENAWMGIWLNSRTTGVSYTTLFLQCERGNALEGVIRRVRPMINL